MGGGAGLCGNKANSAQFQVKLPTGAELGNILDGCNQLYGLKDCYDWEMCQRTETHTT